VILFLTDKRTGINQKKYSNRYLSEDYMFCYNVKRAGMKVWMCPWMSLKHVGTYVFGGSLAHIASIGAAATADPEKLQKTTNRK
jgi:cellulose synthase/poly-beta-1,6-N-acetylglucosamine synthase-like glycosyltransferase